jgi:hypothetical protein
MSARKTVTDSMGGSEREMVRGRLRKRVKEK